MIWLSWEFMTQSTADTILYPHYDPWAGNDLTK
jgi:hypothetical protein